MNGAHIVDRHMNPEQYYADPKDGRYLDGSLKTVRTVNKEDMTAIQASASNRELYFEAAANYKRLFNQDHRVTGLAHFYRQELTNVDWETVCWSAFPNVIRHFPSALPILIKIPIS